MEVVSQLHIDRDEKKKQVLFGGLRASSLIKKVVAGEPVNGKKFSFNTDLIIELHSRICLPPGVRGFLRQTDSTTVGGEPTASITGLDAKFRLYGRWLEEQIEILKSDQSDPILALKIAAAAHYGLTRPELHPFDNGNGRTARALVNAILMLNTCELTKHGLAVPPVPILRSTDPTERDNDYIRSLREIKMTNSLNPFMIFLAQKWIENLADRLGKIKSLVKIPKTDADRQLIAVTQSRLESLKNFVNTGAVKITGDSSGHKTPNKYRVYPIPNYFEMKHVKFTNAEPQKDN